MKIAIFLPGFIKSYNHLKKLEIFLSSMEQYEFYVFGHIFSFVINPKINKEKINYDEKELIDENNLHIFTKYSFVDKNYQQYDKDGYDNRIYSQWYNLAKSFELYKEFSIDNDINCDLFIRLRSDIDIIDKSLFESYIHQCIDENKMCFFKPSCYKISDQIFMGPLVYFEKIINLHEYMESYYEIPFIKQKIQQHKNQPNNPPHNKYLRFSCQSEILFWTHIEKNLQNNEYFIKKHIHGLNREN